MTTATRLAVLDPTVEPIPAHAVVAQRPDTLDGKVIGLLANGKRNSVELLEAIKEAMADRYEFKAVVARNKGNASRPCPAPLAQEMAEECDIIITASGD
ncbi:MAG: hypothetical protein QF898_19250 [SAR202 cluster bacterium]|jgi:hypothetical protein|nr:hypothetical protein [SAR202 cluster bacterium]MDP6512968.1 hypothetical protein [SAR202 cluster bacterium]MDP6716148.1 hypothetical protein [SAR202 cluster bacterium]